MPIRTPASTRQWRHRGDRSSAPLATARAHSSLLSTTGTAAGGTCWCLFHSCCQSVSGSRRRASFSSSCRRTWKAAVLYTLMTRRQLCRPPAAGVMPSWEPCHSERAPRKCEVRSVRFSGLLREERSEAVVPKMASVWAALGWSWYARRTAVNIRSGGGIIRSFFFVSVIFSLFFFRPSKLRYIPIPNLETPRYVAVRCL